MKKLVIFIICLLLCIDIIDNKLLNNYIYNYLYDFYISKDYNVVINTDSLNKNKYIYKDYSNTVKTTNNFYPSNKDELLDVYYTILNNGYDNFIFYCSDNYSSCLDDINDISKDSHMFTSINQLVHPYNSFVTINSRYNSNNRVDVELNKKYSKENIEKIEDKMNEIINELDINSYSNIEDKIRVFHDYLAKTNVYDRAKEKGTSTYNSDSAIGTLFEGHSVCSGYSDTMAIFLNKLGLENVKVITDKHAWNAVKIDNTWYHIDLTWDDPVVSNGENIISHDYFLITTDELKRKDITEHNFDKDFYNFIN